LIKINVVIYHQNKNENNEIALAVIFLDFNFFTLFFSKRVTEEMVRAYNLNTM